MKLKDSISHDSKDITDNVVNIYACGITPYSDAHIGHARSYVVFDLLARVLRQEGKQVRLVRNITDIDDKIIKTAESLGVSWQEHAETYIRRNQELMLKMGVMPTIEPRATEYIDAAVDMINVLLEKGHAYYGTDGSIYFSVASYEGNTILMAHEQGTLLSESGKSRVDVSAKTDTRDFALWKCVSAEEPGFDTPLGRGRPGWHIECSAMIQKLFNGQVTIHGGGVDLKFPHHQSEIMQSESVTGKPLAKVWVHNGSVNAADGVKMSKSLGNFISWQDAYDMARKAAPLHPSLAGMLLYFSFLSTHWQQPMNWTPDSLKEWSDILLSWALAAKDVPAVEDTEGFALLADNLNTPRVFERLHVLAKAKQWGELKYLLNIMNVYLDSWATHYEYLLKRKDVASLLNARKSARSNKDWTTADALRTQLQALGVIVQDH